MIARVLRRSAPAEHPSLFAPPAPAEQIVVGFCTAALMAVADAVAASIRAGGGTAGPGDVGFAALHLLGMTMPLGVLAGLVLGTALYVIRRTPWMDPVRTRLGGGLRRLGAPDPEAFATGLGALLATSGFLVAARAIGLHFATRYHDPALASSAMAVVLLAVGLASIWVAAGIAWLLRPVASHLGKLASLATLVALVAVAVPIAVAAFLRRAPGVLTVYDPIELAWLPASVLAYGLIALGFRRWSRRMRPPRLRRLALVVTAGVAGALVWTGATYGDSNHVRAVVEQRSVSGRTLVRFYADATDRDGDGHAFAFGGNDCDDTNPNIHPGAYDEPGDGIDSDCFAGDGTPDVADFGDGHYGPRPSELEEPNFLLVTVDALRPDHLGCYGYERPVSPNIDDFARRAVRFETVIAQSSRSIRSVPAMRTGFYPSQLKYGPEYLWPAFENTNVTMSEVLAKRGYATAVTMGTNYFERVDHFFQGYERVNQLSRYRPPRPQPIDEALDQLDRLQRKQGPWMLWTHLFNVHEEYLWDNRESEFGEDKIDKYDTELMLADRQIGRLFDELDERGLWDDTVVILTSDHGEAFGEHGKWGHSFTLYEEELRVPLLVHVPGIEPRVVDQTVALFDLVPTVLNLADVPVPRPMPARSLVPLMQGTGRHPQDRLIFSEILPDGLYPYDQKAIRREDMKLIWWVRDGTYQLFDLSRDPGEHHDLSEQRPERAQELLGLLRAWVAQTNRPQHRRTRVLERNRLSEAPDHMTQDLDLPVAGGLFTVLGFDMPRTTVAPGERIEMTFYYRVHAAMDKDLFFFVDIKGPQGFRVPAHFHAHHYPLNGYYRTPNWKAGEILRDPVEMVVPENIEHPVTLRLTLSILADRRHPLPLGQDGQRMVELAEVQVQSPPATP